jgi:hypothetical protein
VLVEVTDASGLTQRRALLVKVIGLAVEPAAATQAPAANAAAQASASPDSSTAPASNASGTGSTASEESKGSTAAEGTGAATEKAAASRTDDERLRVDLPDESSLASLGNATQAGRGASEGARADGAAQDRSGGLTAGVAFAAGQQAVNAPVTLELTRALLAALQELGNDAQQGLAQLLGRGWGLGGRSSDAPGQEIEDVFAPVRQKHGAAEELLLEMTQPERVTGVSLTAGFVWWLTRGGGLLATMLMGVPAWRHMDLLPVMARSDEEDDEDDEEHGRPPGRAHASGRAVPHSAASKQAADPATDAADRSSDSSGMVDASDDAIDDLFERAGPAGPSARG